MLSTLVDTKEESLKEIQEEMKLRRTNEVFLLFAMGSQFDHLIKLALERQGVYCLVANPSTITAEDVMKVKPKGIIVSGGPASVHAEPPKFDERIFDLGIQTLGICLGFQMWAKHVGIPVASAKRKEFSQQTFSHTASLLLEDTPLTFVVQQSHGDQLETGLALDVIGWTNNCQISAGQHGVLWGVQFHPEVQSTEFGDKIFENFCFLICRAKSRFSAKDIAAEKIKELRGQIQDKQVLLALSGGSDSSTVAYLLKEAAKDSNAKIRGVYIKGIDRPDDEFFVKKYFAGQDWMELKIIDETQNFLSATIGKISPQEKRIAMRGVYKLALEREAKLFNANFIAQGTLYTDVSESGGGYQSGARKAQIKLHHNVNLSFSFPELIPLGDCVKDGGRNIGRAIGVPEELLVRHPFPGPGLIIRIEGEVTEEKLAMVRACDSIYIEELRKWDLYDSVWQAGVNITVSRHTCTKGDDNSDGWLVVFWAVNSVDGFTAQASDLPSDFVRHVTKRIGDEVEGVGAVSYRTSDKPPSTIEWG